ncbi:uncharacterized protein LOC131944360 [Physella acuta]|uniref:uncharacterized protein LOC131944360 n=1 Tax=Physella acuta TaxID=109671 RepID=UPI0027DDA76A|nr:uncharacterized protein LOC131944360 [Physella acuta]
MGNFYRKPKRKWVSPSTDLVRYDRQTKDKTIDQPGVFCPGNHEAEMCYGGEAEIHNHVTSCKKNPGHKGFIPVKHFNNKCLPSRYHDDDLMSETIEALAAITVQVKTKFTSLKRPELYPGTQVPYSCFNDRGSHIMRLGTGRLVSVLKYTNDDRKTCRCAKCQISATPSKVWGRFMCGQPHTWCLMPVRRGRPGVF